MQTQPIILPMTAQPVSDAHQRLLLAVAELSAAGEIVSLDMTLAGGLRLSIGERATPPPPADKRRAPLPVPPGGKPRPFSDNEEQILRALANGPLQGIGIAKSMGRPVKSGDIDTKLKYLLSNLLERGVIARVPGEGYGLADVGPADDNAPSPVVAEVPLREQIIQFLKDNPGAHKPQSLVAGLNLGCLDNATRTLLEQMQNEKAISCQPGAGYFIPIGD